MIRHRALSPHAPSLFVTTALVATMLSFACAQAQTTQPGNATAPAPAQAAKSTKPAGTQAGTHAATNVNPLNLSAIVVTGTAHHVTEMQSSVSVSTVGATQIRRLGANSATAVLRNVPGIHTESSGGEGNANVTARGLPISAGGTRYVQFQENGLPVLQFGDLDFATPDSFVRIDGLLSRVQVVRGGSSSVFATNAPGGIINFIDRTGRDQNGSVSVTSGLGFDERRVDFNYGGPIDANDRAEIAGFYHIGTGNRTSGLQVFNGGQIHGNFTHDFSGGFIRFRFKYLNDQTPTYLPVPVSTVNGQIVPLPGIDPRFASFYSSNLGSDVTLTPSNGRAATNFATGLSTKTKSIGFELRKTFDNGFRVDDNFDFAANSGNFLGIYPSGNSIALTGATYADGPNAGLPFTGAAFPAVVFDTKLNNLNLLANNLQVSRNIATGGFGTLTPNVGFYASQQRVFETWNFNSYIFQATQNNPALINSTTSIGGIGSGFGGCCERVINNTYVTTAPYADLGWQIGHFNFDGGIRYDMQSASGYYNFGTLGPNGAFYTPANQQAVNYKVHHLSYSFGGNYEFDRHLSLFARISNGVSFNGDRLISAPNSSLDGTVPIPINVVKQYEGGVKFRQDNFSSFVTLFNADTAESNYDLTTQVSSTNTYRAYGAEVDLGYSYHNLTISGSATYTHARITKTNIADTLGRIPQRQANWIFQISPTYYYHHLTVGANIDGTTSSYGDNQNTIVMPGYVLFGAFLNYQFTPKLSLLITGNNLANAIAYTEFDNISPGVATAARAANGRTVKATLRYKFD
jgi:outer membrane receptor protein involved in Fe transport